MHYTEEKTGITINSTNYPRRLSVIAAASGGKGVREGERGKREKGKELKKRQKEKKK